MTTQPTTTPRRVHTPAIHHPDGSRTITMKRHCNGCDTPVGDATEQEINAAMGGRPLPDVRGECPQCTPAPAVSSGSGGSRAQDGGAQ